MFMSIVGIGLLTDLTELVAAHGAFALVVIFIFYLWNRAVKNLRDAKAPAERKHFQRTHTATVVFTFFLGIISIVIWVYANFIYEEQTIVRGFVSDLIRRDDLPEKPGDPPRLIQEIIPPPRSSDLDFYSEEEFEATGIVLTKGYYTQKWVLFCDPDLDHMIFTFRQQLAARAKMKAETSQARISTTSQPDLERKYFRKRFRLDLAEIEHSLTKPIELIYRPDSLSLDRPGTIFRRDAEGGLRKIPWESAPLSPHVDKAGIFEWVSRFPPLSAITAYAGEKGKDPIFRDDGSYDPQIGRLLRRRLGSPDLSNQLLIKAIVAEGGRRSFKFVMDSLDEPDNADYDRGLLIYNLAEAIREIERTEETVPSELYKAFALSFFDIGDYESSLGFFGKIDSEYIDRENLYFTRAFAYGETEQYDKSIVNYNRALERQDNHYNKAIIYTNLGSVYNNSGQKEKAIEYYHKAIEVDPEYVYGYFNLGAVYYDLGQKEKAIEYYHKVIEVDPEYVVAYNNLGSVYYDLGQKEKAIEYYHKAIEVDPEYADAYNGLAYLYAEGGGNLELAEEYIEHALKIDNRSPYYLDTKGWILVRMAELLEGLTPIQRKKNYYEAERLFNHALELWPEDDEETKADVFYHLGYIEKLRGRQDEAREFFQKALEPDPQHMKAQEPSNE